MFDNILCRSSEVEELEEKTESFWLGFGPNHGGEHVQKSKLRVIIDSSILSGNDKPRFQNHGSNILIFGCEAYRQDFLRKHGFSWEWIYENLLPEKPLAQIIELFPKEKENEKPEPLSAAL